MHMKLRCLPFLLLFARNVPGAFEPCQESPWLGGFAAALFPRSAAAVSLNPAAPGMLERWGVSISASRPFGLNELHRVSVAGSAPVFGAAAGGFISGTSSGGYSEHTIAGAFAFRLARGVLAGVALSGRRLSIEGFGSRCAIGTDAAVVVRPAEGLYLAGGCRGLCSSEIGGDPSVPRTVYVSAGVVPVQGLQVSAAAAHHRYTGVEYALFSSFSPHDGLVLGIGCLSGPPRLSFSIGIDAGSVSVSYGYSTHPDLQGSHSGEVGWGRQAFSPLPLQPSVVQSEEPPVVFPVNVNTATARELEAIPGIGPSKASAILAWLSRNGPVGSVNDLIAVPGIGPSTLETLSRYLTVE